MVTHAGRPATAAVLRLLAVLALVLAGAAALAPAAYADESSPVRAEVVFGCDRIDVTVFNDGEADADVTVTWDGAEPETRPVAVGGSEHFEHVDGLENARPMQMRVGELDVTRTWEAVARCLDVPQAILTPDPCVETVRVQLIAERSHRAIDYFVLGPHDAQPVHNPAGPLKDESMDVAAKPGERVAVFAAGGEMPVADLVVPPCVPIETPPVVTVAAPVPNQEVAVLGTKFSATATAASVPQAPAETAVLGTKVAAAPELARTGPRETAVLTGAGALLVLTGAGLMQAGRRREAPRG